MDRLRATLAASSALSPTVRHLVLRTDRPLAFSAGQWVNLHVQLPDGSEAKRPYSIANAPGPGGVSSELDILVTHVPGGLVSPALTALEVGAEVGCDGPHGFFVREQGTTGPVLLVGTGSGLAPLRAMAQEMLADGAAAVGLLFGVRSQADILFREELEGWAQDHRAFRLDVTLSRPAQGWGGLRGYVQEQLLDVIGDARPEVYICGLSPMVKAVRAVLKTQLGYDRKHVHSERYD